MKDLKAIEAPCITWKDAVWKSKYRTEGHDIGRRESKSNGQRSTEDWTT